MHEWQRKSISDKIWENFKLYFATEAKDYKHNNSTTAKLVGYQVVNATSQALLEAQQDFKEVANNFISEFKSSL